MRISIKTRLIAIGTTILLLLVGVGIILWYHHRPTQIVPKPTITQKALIEPSVKSASIKKNISNEQIIKLKNNQDEEAQKKQVIAFLDSLSSNDQEKSTINDLEKENGKDKNESDLAKQNELLRQQFADEARTNIPELIEQWKIMKARIDMLGTRTDRSEADDKELEYLRETKRLEIEGQIMILISRYLAAFPEDRGAIYYPDGWIGQLLKPIGIVYR